MKRQYLIKSVMPLLLCLVLTAAFLTGCCISIGDLAKAKFERTDNLQTSLASGSTVVVDTDVGSITVTGVDTAECNVTANITVKAPSEEEAREIAEKIEIELVPAGQILTVKTHKPRVKNNRVMIIDFVITVPKQTALQLESDVGKIKVWNITERIHAETQVGGITCREVAGDLELKTDVGRVEAVYSKTAPAAPDVTIETDVGKIEFTAPPDFSATVDAATDVGSIKTDVPLTVKGKIGKSVRGSIGKGQGRLRLRTDVGSIRIRQREVGCGQST